MSKKKDLLKKLAKKKRKEKKKRKKHQHSNESEDDSSYCAENQAVGDQELAVETAEEAAPLLELVDNAEDLSREKRKLHKKKKAKDKGDKSTDHKEKHAQMQAIVENTINEEQHSRKKRKHDQTDFDHELEHHQDTEKEYCKAKKKRKREHTLKETDSDPNISVIEHNNNGNSIIIPKNNTPEHSLKLDNNRRKHKKTKEKENYSNNISEIIPESDIQTSLKDLEGIKNLSSHKSKRNNEEASQSSNSIRDIIPELTEETEPAIELDDKAENRPRRERTRQKENLDISNNSHKITREINASEQSDLLKERHYEERFKEKDSDNFTATDSTSWDTDPMDEKTRIKMKNRAYMAQVYSDPEKHARFKEATNRKAKLKKMRTKEELGEEQFNYIHELALERRREVDRQRLLRRMSHYKQLIEEGKLTDEDPTKHERNVARCKRYYKRLENGTAFKNYSRRKNQSERNDTSEKRKNPSEKTINPLENRINPLEKRINPLEKRINPLENRINPLENRINSLENRMNPLEKRTNPLEKMINPLEKMINPSEKMKTTVFVRRKCSEKIEVFNIRKRMTLIRKGIIVDEDPIVQEENLAKAKRYFTQLKRKPFEKMEDYFHRVKMTRIIKGIIVYDDPIVQEENFAEAKRYFESVKMIPSVRVKPCVLRKRFEKEEDFNIRKRMTLIMKGIIVDEDPIVQEENLAKAKKYFTRVKRKPFEKMEDYFHRVKMTHIMEGVIVDDDPIVQEENLAKAKCYFESVKRKPVKKKEPYERRKRNESKDDYCHRLRMTRIMAGIIVDDDPIVQEENLAKAKCYFESMERKPVKKKEPYERRKRNESKDDYRHRLRMTRIMAGIIVDDDPIVQEENLAEAKSYFESVKRKPAKRKLSANRKLSAKRKPYVGKKPHVRRKALEKKEDYFHRRRMTHIMQGVIAYEDPIVQEQNLAEARSYFESVKKKASAIKKPYEKRKRYETKVESDHRIRMTQIVKGIIVDDDPIVQEENLAKANKYLESVKRIPFEKRDVYAHRVKMTNIREGIIVDEDPIVQEENLAKAKRYFENVKTKSLVKTKPYLRRKPNESLDDYDLRLRMTQIIEGLIVDDDPIIQEENLAKAKRYFESVKTQKKAEIRRILKENIKLSMLNISSVQSRGQSQRISTGNTIQYNANEDEHTDEVMVNLDEHIDTIVPRQPPNALNEENSGSVNRKAKNTVADFTIDTTESIEVLLENFEHKNKYVYNVCRRLMGRIHNEGKNVAPHFLLPSLPLNTFPDDFDGTLPPRYFEKFAYKCTMPCVTTRMKNLTYKDPVTQMMRVKSQWKKDVHYIAKGASITNAPEKTVKRNATVYTCPEKLVRLAVTMEQDPDPNFDDAYNWYYAGNGNVQVLSVNDADCLLHSQLNRLYLSKFSRRKLRTKNTYLASFDCGEGNNIFETICNINNYVVIRLKHKIYILKLTTEENTLKFLNFNEIDSKVPYTSIEFDIYQKNVLYITKLDGTLSIVNLDVTKARTLELMKGSPMLNNWNKVITLDNTSYCHVTKDFLKIYDKRTNNVVYEFTELKSNYSERQCDDISAVKKVEDAPFVFIATSHFVFLMDLRWQGNYKPRVLRRWTHHMQNVPTYISQIKHDLNKDLICLSSQWPEETCLISNDIDIYNEIAFPSSMTLPYKLPTFATILGEAKSKMLCVDIYHPLEQRIYTSLTGNCVMAADENVLILTLNSLGDIFAYTLYPEHLDKEDDSIERLHEWGSTMSKERCFYETTEVVDISHVWRSLKKVPSDFVIGDRPVRNAMSKCNYSVEAVFDICESGEVDGALLDAWIEEEKDENETKLGDTGLNIDLHFSDSE